jgi:hypothetical protein
MARIEIISITGTSPYYVYVSDVYGNNKSYVGTIGSAVPPVEYFYLPTIFNNAPAIMLTIIDSNGCEKFEIIECRYGCGFAIQIVAADCIFTIAIDNPDCAFDTILY